MLTLSICQLTAVHKTLRVLFTNFERPTLSSKVVHHHAHGVALAEPRGEDRRSRSSWWARADEARMVVHNGRGARGTLKIFEENRKVF